VNGLEAVRPGLLVTLEGPGGAGKSTVTELVAGRLSAAGLPVLATTEPSRTGLGSFVRRSTDEYGGLTFAYLVAADRHHHLETEVRPALGAGRVVVCDRYIASSLVLQGMDGVEEQTIWDLARHAELPDIAVVLCADPDVLAARVAARGPHSRWERYPGNSAIEARLYLAAADTLRARGVYVVTVDSSATPAPAIADQVTGLVQTRWEERLAGRPRRA